MAKDKGKDKGDKSDDDENSDNEAEEFILDVLRDLDNDDNQK